MVVIAIFYRCDSFRWILRWIRKKCFSSSVFYFLEQKIFEKSWFDFDILKSAFFLKSFRLVSRISFTHSDFTPITSILSLFLSLTHMNLLKHALIFRCFNSLSLFLSLSPSFSLYVCLCLSHTHTHTHTRTYSNTDSHSDAPILFLSLLLLSIQCLFIPYNMLAE